MNNLRATGTRWLKFNAVGGIGIVVQLACLAVLTACMRITCWEPLWPWKRQSYTTSYGTSGSPGLNGGVLDSSTP